MGVEKPGWIVLYVLTVVTFAVTIVVNYGLSTGSVILGLNFTSQGDMSDKYYIDITPSTWTFLIWLAIYVWQFLWMIYVGTLICRKSDKGYLHCAPAFFSPMIFVAYILNLLCNIGWNFVWSLEYVHYALLFIALVPFFLYICLVASFYGLRRHGQELINQGKKKDVILNILLVQNGLGIYATWVTIATLLNLAIVLRYFADLDLQLCGTIALVIVAFELIVWFILDNFVFEKACRYFFIPYCVLIWAVAGSIEKNWQTGARNSIISVVLICVGAVALLVKIILVIVRSRREALFEWRGTNEEKKTIE